MKVRESGMPAVALWESFFDPPQILRQLGLQADCASALEFGCGYGTFTLSAARLVAGSVIAIDIESAMLDHARKRAVAAGITTIEFVERDFIAAGSGLSDGSFDYVMLFNILHGADPVALLHEAWRNLAGGGKLGAIHWIADPATPRGPPMDIRPRPAQIVEWGQQAGFECAIPLDLPPYHYGVVMTKPP